MPSRCPQIECHVGLEIFVTRVETLSSEHLSVKNKWSLEAGGFDAGGTGGVVHCSVASFFSQM